jgi:hypothetical protein
MTAFVGAALLKPWGDGSRREPVTPSPVASDAVRLVPDVLPPPAVSGWAGISFVPGPRPAIDPAIVRASLRAEPRWGIRAVVDVSPDGQPTTPAHLEERWAPAGPGGGASPATNGYPIRALGVTLGPGTVALDVRVLREVRGRERWLDVEPVGGGNPGATVLFWPPRGPAGWGTTWEPGRYRFFVLTADRVVDLEVFLLGSNPPNVPADSDAQLWQGSTPRGGWLGLETRLGEGPFAGVIATDSGVSSDHLVPVLVPLGGRPVASLDLGSAWLGPTGERSAAAGAPAAYLPTAVAVGVAAEPGLRIDTARLVRMLPDGPASRPVLLDTAVPIVTNIDDVPRRDVVGFEAPGGRPWPAGIYAVQLVATGPAGLLTRTYPITLLPGSARSVPAPLAAARAWARFAGSWGIAAGLREPLEGPARLAIRYAPQVPEPVAARGADFSRRCLEVNLVDTAQPILGISHPLGAAPDSIGLERIFLDGTTAGPDPAVARSVVPGLTLVAAREGAEWAPGWYRLILGQDGSATALPFCVGRVIGSMLAVPADAGRRVAAADANG